MFRHRPLHLALLVLLLSACLQTVAQEVIEIDANAQTTPFPHFWEEMFGSGRAILTLRESYRDDLRAVKKITGIRYVRFHAILHDELGVYNEDEHGDPVYNFAYVDQVYDGLLKNGIKPFVEISFMPKKLAFNPDALHPFWYKQNVSPPKSMERWDDLMTRFARHLVDRYGINEVAQWYFEVWNEPNIDFWNGIPRKQSYFDLYDHTARALKAVSPRLRVGGPATSAAHWVDDFLKHTAAARVPVDFVSTHGYADDTVQDMLGTNENIPMDDRVCLAVKKVRKQIQISSTPKLPLFWTEWNVPGAMQARDTTYVGPALANTVRECDGMVDMMSFWTFSDVFEEGGPMQRPFVGAFGLRAKGGINKPSYYDFALLHELGEQRLSNPSNNVIVTKNKDGSLVIAAWNLVDLFSDDKTKGSTKTVTMEFRNVPHNAEVSIERVDDEHGNVLPKYIAMGSPVDPTEAQVEQLNRETAMGQPDRTRLKDGRLALTLERNSLTVLQVIMHQE
jgi:xylan 1,4-beta-xylosidase